MVQFDADPIARRIAELHSGEAPTSSRLAVVFIFSCLTNLAKFDFRLSFLYVLCGANSREMGRMANSVIFKSRCNTRENAGEFAQHVAYLASIDHQSSYDILSCTQPSTATVFPAFASQVADTPYHRYARLTKIMCRHI